MAKLIRYIFITLFLLTTYCLLFTTSALAQGEFSTDYDVTYQVSPEGKTGVTQNIRLTNLTTNFFAALYTLLIGNTKVENVKALGEGSSQLPLETKFEQNTTTVNVKFTQPTVGKGKVLSWQLSYDAPELAVKSGSIWEVNIPRLADIENISSYKVTLTVPETFGPAAFISPEPASRFNNSFVFEKDQLAKTGISASFGRTQVFSFELIYHLNNPKLQPIQTEIALPPDNSYQKVILSELAPKPEDVRVDEDGNWLATYNLSRLQTLDVKASGLVEVHHRPILVNGKKIIIPEKYLKPATYWEIDNDYFRQKAGQLKTPREIYDFVTDFLSYDQARLDSDQVVRLGAAGAVENPKNAVCMEFTDLFITLARSAGIPAREVNGFAYTTNERLRPLSLRYLGADILHSWPEYWDENLSTWVQVDPTWGSTSGGLDYFSKLDFNHITFVQKGLSSTYPIPAGAYKLDSTAGGDVNITFAKAPTQPAPQAKISLKIPKNILSGFSWSGEIKIENAGNVTIDEAKLAITVTGAKLGTPASFDLGNLPPYANRTLTVNFSTDSFLAKGWGTITATIADDEAVANFQIRPSLFFAITALASGVLIIGVLVFGVTLLIKRFKRWPL